MLEKVFPLLLYDRMVILTDPCIELSTPRRVLGHGHGWPAALTTGKKLDGCTPGTAGNWGPRSVLVVK
jgi:hypothetical protein